MTKANIVPHRRIGVGALTLLVVGLLWSSNVLVGAASNGAGLTSTVGTAEAGSRIIVRFVFVNTGEETSDQFPSKAPLHAVKTIVLAITDTKSPSEKDLFKVLRTPDGNPLDETLNLEELGITDGGILFLEYK